MTKTSVLVSIFTMNERDGWITPELAGFVASLSSADRRIALKIIKNTTPIDHARNCVANDFLSSDFEWLLMVDNDMGPPQDPFAMLDRAEEHMRVVVPKYFGLIGSPNPASITLGLAWRSATGSQLRGEWRELAWAGTGFMFVHRAVFEKLGNQPYFRFTYDGNGKIAASEDFEFCQKAWKAGFPIWGNVNFEADHFKTVSMSALARVFERAGARLGGQLPIPKSMEPFVSER